MRQSNCAVRTRGGALPRCSGFSLLELLLVVTLLGVLVVTTLPRFFDRETGSDTTYLHRVAGDLEAGAALFHAQWVAAGRPARSAQLPGFESLRIGATGYPQGGDDERLADPSLATSEDCAALFRGLLGATAPSVVAATKQADPGRQSADFTAVATGTECQFFLTRGFRQSAGTADELSMLRYHTDRGRTELKHQVRLPAAAH